MNKFEHQPIACDLTAIPAEVREAHMVNGQHIFQAAVEICELANGYSIRLPNTTGMWMALATFVENERRCCPFWHFDLTVEANNGPLWLALTGPEGAKDLLTAALAAPDDEGRFPG
jgi:hypothetical protein